VIVPFFNLFREGIELLVSLLILVGRKGLTLISVCWSGLIDGGRFSAIAEALEKMYATDMGLLRFTTDSIVMIPMMSSALRRTPL
jgi:hypothetical protein